MREKGRAADQAAPLRRQWQAVAAARGACPARQGQAEASAVPRVSQRATRAVTLVCHSAFSHTRQGGGVGRSLPACSSSSLLSNQPPPSLPYLPYLVDGRVDFDVHVVAQLVGAQVDGERDETFSAEGARERVARARAQAVAGRHGGVRGAGCRVGCTESVRRLLVCLCVWMNGNGGCEAAGSGRESGEAAAAPSAKSTAALFFACVRTRREIVPAVQRPARLARHRSLVIQVRTWRQCVRVFGTPRPGRRREEFCSIDLLPSLCFLGSSRAHSHWRRMARGSQEKEWARLDRAGSGVRGRGARGGQTKGDAP